jgi:hypothetical protein
MALELVLTPNYPVHAHPPRYSFLELTDKTCGYKARREVLTAQPTPPTPFAPSTSEPQLRTINVRVESSGGSRWLLQSMYFEGYLAKVVLSWSLQGCCVGWLIMNERCLVRITHVWKPISHSFSFGPAARSMQLTRPSTNGMQKGVKSREIFMQRGPSSHLRMIKKLQHTARVPCRLAGLPLPVISLSSFISLRQPPSLPF